MLSELRAPAVVNGVDQMPIHGTSMRYCFTEPAAKSRRQTQYFEILGNRAIYHEGWIASCFHGRLPWIRFAGFKFDGPEEGLGVVQYCRRLFAIQ